MHHCIQGWSGIAQWGGLPFKRLIELVKPRPEAKVVAFYSYGDALYGGEYYDTQTIETALKARCLLAYEMNQAPLAIVSRSHTLSVCRIRARLGTAMRMRRASSFPAIQ